MEHGAYGFEKYKTLVISAVESAVKGTVLVLSSLTPTTPSVRSIVRFSSTEITTELCYIISIYIHTADNPQTVPQQLAQVYMHDYISLLMKCVLQPASDIEL